MPKNIYLCTNLTCGKTVIRVRNPPRCKCGSQFEKHDIAFECPACGNLEGELDGYDVLGADEGKVFCNSCGAEVDPIEREAEV